MATVRQLLDRLAAGQVTTEEVAADFRRRSWPSRRPATDAQRWGVADDEPDDGDDSWSLVETDSRLTAAQYAALVRAHG